MESDPGWILKAGLWDIVIPVGPREEKNQDEVKNSYLSICIRNGVF